MPYYSWADVVHLLAERYDTKSNVKLGGFQSQLQASCVSSHTEKLWYNKTVCLWMTIYIYIYICWGWPEGSLFNSYYTGISGRVLLLFLNCSTLPLIHTIYCWVLSKEISSTIFEVFGMTQPGIETQVSWTIDDTLTTRPMRHTHTHTHTHVYIYLTKGK